MSINEVLADMSGWFGSLGWNKPLIKEQSGDFAWYDTTQGRWIFPQGTSRVEPLQALRGYKIMLPIEVQLDTFTYRGDPVPLNRTMDLAATDRTGDEKKWLNRRGNWIGFPYCEARDFTEGMLLHPYVRLDRFSTLHYYEATSEWHWLDKIYVTGRSHPSGGWAGWQGGHYTDGDDMRIEPGKGYILTVGKSGTVGPKRGVTVLDGGKGRAAEERQCVTRIDTTTVALSDQLGDDQPERLKIAAQCCTTDQQCMRHVGDDPTHANCIAGIESDAAGLAITTFAEASALCDQAGLVLCDATAPAGGACITEGCQYDNQAVWTGIPCDEPTEGSPSALPLLPPPASPPPPHAPPLPPDWRTSTLCGDVDGDGIVAGLTDARTALTIANGLGARFYPDRNLTYQITDAVLNRADVNGDGNVTAADAELLQHVYSDLEPTEALRCPLPPSPPMMPPSLSPTPSKPPSCGQSGAKCGADKDCCEARSSSDGVEQVCGASFTCTACVPLGGSCASSVLHPMGSPCCGYDDFGSGTGAHCELTLNGPICVPKFEAGHSCSWDDECDSHNCGGPWFVQYCM